MSLILLGILNSQAAAAGGAGAYDLLETQVLTSSASSVTFTGLGSYSDYKHLQLRCVLQDIQGSTNLNNGYIKLNNDTSSIYARHQLQGNGSSVSSNASSSQTSALFYDFFEDGGYPDRFGAAIFDILDFSSTSKNTTIRGLGGAASRQYMIGLWSALYASTSAITQLEIWSATNDVAAGSRFSLYGIKGA